MVFSLGGDWSGGVEGRTGRGRSGVERRRRDESGLLVVNQVRLERGRRGCRRQTPPEQRKRHSGKKEKPETSFSYIRFFFPLRLQRTLSTITYLVGFDVPSYDIWTR
jgi:hypothetical protein